VDIENIAKPVCKWAVTVREPALVPRAFQQAFHVMRSGRPGPVLTDLPFDVHAAEIEFDEETYAPPPAYKPRTTRAQAEKALAMLDEAERPLIVAGGGVINADASDLLVRFAEITGVPVIPTLMGWGTIPDDHPLMAGMVGLQTAHRYGNATLLASDFVFGVGNRWANRHTGSVETYTRGRKFVHVDIEPTQIGRVFEPDYGIVSDAGAALELLVGLAAEWRRSGRLKDRSAWGESRGRRRPQGSDPAGQLAEEGWPLSAALPRAGEVGRQAGRAAQPAGRRQPRAQQASRIAAGDGKLKPMAQAPRDLLRAMFDAAVAAAVPVRRVPASLPPRPKRRTVAVGAGKASAAMAKAVEDHWDGPLEGLVVTRYGHGAPCCRIEIVEAAHPEPGPTAPDAT
jgi:thiamine pyrophosphate-dependent acetolactate synthase large subunit-like protein